MVVRIQIILLSTAVIARTYYIHQQGCWMFSEAVVNVCNLPTSRRQSLNTSCDFETSECTARFTSPMSTYWKLKNGSIGNILAGDHSRNSSGTYYLFNAANYFIIGDQHRGQLMLPLVLNNNICLRFWYNLVSVKSNLKVIVNGHTIFNQTNIITHGWVQKNFFISDRAPVQIIFESTKLNTLGYVGIDDVILETEKHSSTTKGLRSTRLSSKSFTSSSTARKSALTTPNLAITLTSFISARTARTPTSLAHTFTNILHTTKHTIGTTALVTSIGTHKSITGNNKTSISTKNQSTTARQTATKPRSAITARRTASTAVHLSTTAHRTIVSTTTAKLPLFVSTTTAAPKPSLKLIPTTKTTTTYASTTPIIFTFGRLSKISQSTTMATSLSSVRKYSTSVPTRQPAFTYFMTTATQAASKTTITTKPSATHKSMTPKFTSLVQTSKPNISKSDPVNNITSPKSTNSNNKSTTSATNRRTTRRKTDSATILFSATTAKTNVSRTVPLSTTAHRSSISTTTAKTSSIINTTTATSKPPFKTTHTTKTTTTYVSTTPVRFTFGRLSTIANSTTSAISLSSARHMSTSVPTRQPTFTYWMTTTPKSSFASTPTTKPTTINTSNTYKAVNLVNTSISNIRNTVHVTNMGTPKSTTTNNTSITSVTSQNTTHRKPASQTTPLSATTATKTVSKNAPVSVTVHRTSASSTITKLPSFISAMTSSVQSPFKTTPTAKTTTSYSSTLPIIFTFYRSTTTFTSTSLATSPSFVIKFATSIPTRKPSFTYAVTTGTKSSLTNSPTTNPTTTRKSTVTKLISWVHTRTSNSDKPDHVTNILTPKTTNITITSSTSAPIPRTDHITNVSTSTPISSSSTKETTSTIVPLSAIAHKTDPTLAAISKSKLQSTNTSSVNVFVTFFSNAALALSTTKRPVISSIVSPTQPDSITRAEPMSPAASEIFKVTFSSSRTIKTTTTSQIENNTHTNVQINSFAQKEVKSTVTSSALFKSISPGNMGRFDKHQISSGGSSANETVITAILCALAGMLLLIILFVIILRRKNGRSPFTVIAKRVNVNLFEDPNDGSETVLIQLRQMNN